jgi:hypothetical protein
MNDLLAHLLSALLVGVLAILTPVWLAPFEALFWWVRDAARQTSDRENAAPALPVAPASSAPPATHYVVYLSGIGDITGEGFGPYEARFLELLAQRIPGMALVRDIFPYSVTNLGLTGQRAFGWLWRRAVAGKSQGKRIGELINARNAFQVLVSADHRYGPIYSYGLAELMVRSLVQQGYPLGSGTPVTLIGYSGGGQMSLGASTYLKAMLGAPVRLISIGGVLSSDPGLEHLEHVYHLFGSKDGLQNIDAIFPGRWPMFFRSSWNSALSEGRITLLPQGPVEHADIRGYFGTDHAPDGQRLVDRTVAVVARLLEHADEYEQARRVLTDSA